MWVLDTHQLCPFDLGNRRCSYFTKSQVTLRKVKCPDQGDTDAGWLDQPLCQRALGSWFCVLLCVGDIVAGNTLAVTVFVMGKLLAIPKPWYPVVGRIMPPPQDAYILTPRT